MTLNTVAYITGPIGGQHAYDLAVAAILAASGEAARLPVVHHDAPLIESDGTVHLSTTMGQGIAGWTWCHYRPDGPLHMADDWEDGCRSTVRCTLTVSWDTGYSYHDEGGDCEALHHRALRLLQASLPQGVTMEWRDEFTGEMHTGAPLEGAAA